MNKIVRENINFKRGVGSKKGLGVGRARLQPTIYGAYINTEDPAKEGQLEEYKEKFDYIDEIEHYDVFLIDRNISNYEIAEIFYESPPPEELPFEHLGQVVGGIEQNAMGGMDFSVLGIDPKEWEEFNIEDLKILDVDGEEENIDITEVV